MRYGTAYYDLEADPAIFETAVRALAEGNSLRATARIVQIDKDTACVGLDRAAQHCRVVMLYLWRNLQVTECQLDELWSFVHTKEHNLLAAKIYKDTYGDAWVWIAFAPAWRLVPAFVIGKRVQENADLLIERLKEIKPDCVINSPEAESECLPNTLRARALAQLYGIFRETNRGLCTNKLARAELTRI